MIQMFCRGLLSIVSLPILAGLLATGAEAVNPPKKVVPEHVNRGLLIGNCAFVDEMKPTVTAGGFTQVSLKKFGARLGPHRSQVIDPPRWYAHLMVTGGARTDFDDYAIFGQLGVVRRNESTTFTSAGIVGQVVLPVEGFGPLGRVEVMDVLGLQVGPMYFKKSEEWGVFASVDFFHLLFDDLGLKP